MSLVPKGHSNSQADDPVKILEKRLVESLNRADQLKSRTSMVVAWYLQAALDSIQGNIVEAQQSARFAAKSITVLKI